MCIVLFDYMVYVRYLPPSLLTLYYSLIFPHINYCNIVLAATYLIYLTKLLIIQKRFLRMISHSNGYKLEVFG